MKYDTEQLAAVHTADNEYTDVPAEAFSRTDTVCSKLFQKRLSLPPLLIVPSTTCIVNVVDTLTDG